MGTSARLRYQSNMSSEELIMFFRESLKDAMELSNLLTSKRRINLATLIWACCMLCIASSGESPLAISSWSISFLKKSEPCRIYLADLYLVPRKPLSRSSSDAIFSRVFIYNSEISPSSYSSNSGSLTLGNEMFCSF